jgi:hypothetical protein
MSAENTHGSAGGSKVYGRTIVAKEWMRGHGRPESAGGSKFFRRKILIEEWIGGPGKIASDVFRDPIPDSAGIGQRFPKRRPHAIRASVPRRTR